MPAIGVAMTEGLLVRWVKRTGDEVAAGDVVLEIETDKSVIEVDSPATGTIGKLLFQEGDIVPTGVAVTSILEAGDRDAGLAATAVEAEAPIGAIDGPLREDPADASRNQDVAEARVADQGREPHQLSPRQRRLAREQANQPGSASANALPAEHGARPASPADRHRAVIAERVSSSWATIPHFAVTREVVATAMELVRDRYLAGKRPGFTDLMLRALALALRATGEPGDIDVGLAVATPRGVTIPVLRQVLGMSLETQAEATAGAVSRAREGRLTPDDLQHPPRSTLSNLGPQGVDSFTGVIAMGQTTLLTVGRIRPRPYVIGRALGIRSSFDATINADHRAMDGEDASLLLMAFVNAVEDADVLTDQGRAS